MSISVSCFDTKQVIDMNNENSYVREQRTIRGQPTGFYEVVFNCPCGCGEIQSALVPTYEKYVETKKFWKEVLGEKIPT